MSFDALTIAGTLSAILAGGFFIALGSRNDGRVKGAAIRRGVPERKQGR